MSNFTAPNIDNSPRRTSFECLFCHRAHESLSFYGCCSACYQSSEAVRAVVDEAHPQTPVVAW